MQEERVGRAIRHHSIDVRTLNTKGESVRKGMEDYITRERWRDSTACYVRRKTGSEGKMKDDIKGKFSPYLKKRMKSESRDNNGEQNGKRMSAA